LFEEMVFNFEVLSILPGVILRNLIAENEEMGQFALGYSDEE